VIVVLDTNVLLPALNWNHAFAVILEAWHRRRLTWAISTDILLEYQEVVTRRSGAARWHALERLLELSASHGSNLIQASPSYFFRTISADRDDDKFADCAISANADFIITQDSHFKSLIGSGYRPQPISPEEFISRFLRA
jgi:putative PIN family toxin of toxin-antitoxin system